ncbi:M28 family peptidase [Cecembia lonarensis]|uniref:Putative aminopeptidase, Iap family n=1 Tax=Cecembia lonarensis (strain CCUG 58316 / KCTC 22772 / LW9) TaxID=1225176 RepID=K1LHS1_CECL9|nr:M28 family peptidase [Cecembia lonarensis]EKB49753.1 putative aminopeptidase, Iap family [Cecembia lonarensis LW9]
MIREKISLLILASLFSFTAFCQNGKEAIEANFNERASISHFRFLASDELMGRDPIRPEIDAAARYIAEQFWKYGAKEIPGANGYYQNIPFRLSSPPSMGEVILGDHTFSQGDDLLVLDGPSLAGSYELVVLGFGLEKDYEGKDVQGKIVVTNVGAPNRLSPSDLFAAGREKTALAKQKGAIGIIEIYNVPTVPWALVSNFLNRTQLTVDTNPGEESIPYIWLRDLSNTQINAIGKGEITQAKFNIAGKVNRSIIGKNVVAVIEGTDPVLKNEYVMLSAHYDHIGVGRPNAEGDSIYNGARDNAVGTVAVINAARYFAQNPPKRSILLCAWTAEEKGLLGSAYFAENPLVPLNQIIFNLNIDNAGYNDTSIVTVVGLGRTSADHLISEATAAFGLEAIADPSPEQGLYDRSDNVNFARKGIPAPTFSLGFTAFDDEISRHYHQPSDEVDSFDLDYAVLYWKSYLLSAENIANWSERPKWNEGDKYEEVSKALYGIK